jgi:hypothetical protein
MRHLLYVATASLLVAGVKGQCTDSTFQNYLNKAGSPCRNVKLECDDSTASNYVSSACTPVLGRGKGAGLGRVKVGGESVKWFWLCF